MPSHRPMGSVAFVTLSAAALTVAVIVVAAVRIEVHSPAAGVIVVSARGTAELFAALLAAQRFRRTGSRLDLGIGTGLGLMAVADLVFSLGRATLSGDEVSAIAVMPYHLVGAGLLATAAVAPERPLLRREHRRAAVAAVATAAAALLALQQAKVLPGARPLDDPQALGVVLLRLGTCALLATAAAAFTWRRRAHADPLVRWLVAAATLGALAQLMRVLVPIAAPASTFTWAQVLQLAAAASLLVGVIEETHGYQHRLAELAAADERRRIARDLHDGVAQDVAFIASQSRDLARDSGDRRLGLIAEAAQRALADSRYIISALSHASSQPLGASIAVQAQDFARRWGLAVNVAVDRDVDVAPEKQEAILRILGEALSNAARHAGASSVDICLDERDGRLRIAIQDDGRGFDTDAAQVASRGFGLRSMRERAELVGADLRLESEPGAGTRVELALS